MTKNNRMDTKLEDIQISGRNRKEAFEKLKVFLSNPGRFSLLVIGRRGTGKRFSIEKAFEKVKDDKEINCLTSIEFIAANNIQNDIDLLDELLKRYEYKTLVIEDIDDLEFEQQNLLFRALSTTDGRFGIKEKFDIRLVFTSSKDCDSLREDGKYLTGVLWDRISQLIVEFPSYIHEDENVVKDFKFTWEKMKFEEIEDYKSLSKLPKTATLETFLEDNADKFEGGFRDLDKLACMYFNYRIYHYGTKRKIDDNIEKKVVESVKSDFFSKSQMQGDSGNDASVFQIRTGFSMDDLLGQFKIQVRKWARKEYDTIKNAEKKLGLRPGTMKNYVEGKVTKSQKSPKK